MRGFIVEFWPYLRVRKKFWLAPMIMSIAVVNPLFRATQGTRHRAISEAKLQRHSRKAERRLDAQRKITIAEAVITGRSGFRGTYQAIVRKRLTRPFDVTVMAEWQSTT
jgi:hypothetical protein